MSVALELPALLVGEGLPLFEAITPDQIQLHIPQLLSQLESELSALEAGFSSLL